MATSTIDALSRKLIRIIQTKDHEKVSYWVDRLDKQKDQFLVAQIMARINRYLKAHDEPLYQWFHEIYFADYSPEVKKLWLDFVNLCSLSL